MIPYGHQSISQEDIDAVVSVLRSEFITQGPSIEAFERAMADYCGVKHAVAVATGTAALHLACAAAGLKAGDTLWTSPNTFVASANCALYCGAGVDFVDIDPRTYNLDVEALRRKLESAKQQDALPAVVVPVHFAGQSCDMVAIAELAEEYGFLVLEDASHAVGGRYRDSPVGSCEFSDAAVFSFHPVKIITTGEGGMVVTNDDALAAQVRLLRSHGTTKDPALMTGDSDGDWYYQQVALGFNYRITDIQAALGLSQMRRLDEFVARRNHLAERYDRLLEGLPLTLPYRSPEVVSAFHLYVVRIDGMTPDGGGRRRVFDLLRAKGVGVHVHYVPVHTQPYYADLGFAHGDFPEAERYYAECLTLPLYASMTEGDQDTVVEGLRLGLADR